MYIGTLIKRNKNLDINFKQLVFQCAYNYMSVIQWLENGSLETALNYKTKAICLLEILEIIVCGSVGGFDNGQYSNGCGRFDQRKYTHDFDRLLWIWNKYTDFNKESEYHKYMEDLKEYFSSKEK